MTADEVDVAEAPASLAQQAVAALKETVLVVAMALVLSFVVKTWLLQAFFIPSGSMEDTLVEHDRVVVNKLVPGVMDLHRGDIVVFEDPGDWLAPRVPVDCGRGNSQPGADLCGIAPQ